MTTTKNNEHKKLNFSSEREQSQACLNSAEHEKNQGRKVLNVPNKQEQNQTCLDSAEREGLRPKGNVPNLRFKEFEGEWEKCILGDITENFNLRNKDKIQYPMFSVTNDRGFVPQSEQFEGRDMVGEDIKAYKIIHTNDFAYNPARINVGSIAMYTGEKPCMISSLYVCFKTTKEVNNEWLMQLLKIPKMNYYYKVNGEGGVRVYLFYPNFARIRMSIPKIEEQKKIAKLLNLIDERIATQNKIIEDLKKLKSAIIDYAINSLNTDFAKFGSLYEMAGEGGTPTTSNASFYDNGKIPFIKIDDLKQKYLTENKDFITELGLQKSSAWLVPTHSILFSNGATIGEISITTYPVCTKQGILGIVPKQNIDVEFLYYFMSSSYFKKAVSRIVTEGTMKTAYLKDINNILCPIPTKEKQQEIAKMPSALNSKIDFEQSILKLFCSQKQYLLRQMFI